MPSLEVVRDRILDNLNRRVAKHSPEYKRTKTVLDNFIGEALGQTGETTASQ